MTLFYNVQSYTMTNVKKRQPESVSDFKQRICIMMRERETGKKYSIVGASRADECVLRKHKKNEHNKPTNT